MNEDQKATAINVKQQEEDHKKNVLELTVESFFARWQPADRHDAARFAGEFYSLVRQIYADAGKPAHDQLMRFVNAIPLNTWGINLESKKQAGGG